MASSNPPQTQRKRRNVMAAVVLGTALSTMGAAPAATAATPETVAQSLRDISRYCTACWRNARLPADCWNDCTQEVLTRLLQTLPHNRWKNVFKPEAEERQEFVRAIDAVKKRTQRRVKRSHELTGVVADPRNTREVSRRDDREAVRRAAVVHLSARQQKILQMSLDGWSVHDIAGELSVPPARISDEKYKAVRKLQQVLAE